MDLIKKGKWDSYEWMGVDWNGIKWEEEAERKMRERIWEETTKIKGPCVET